MGDHTETVQIKYDPEIISFGEFLKVFYEIHDPTFKYQSPQYMSLILYHDPEQKDLAQKEKKKLSEKFMGEVQTRIEEYISFYPAEDYHQKYFLQAFPEIMKELKKNSPDFQTLIKSKTAARINGYISGFGSKEQLEKGLQKFNLDQETKRIIQNLFTYKNR